MTPASPASDRGLLPPSRAMVLAVVEASRQGKFWLRGLAPSHVGMGSTSPKRRRLQTPATFIPVLDQGALHSLPGQAVAWRSLPPDGSGGARRSLLCSSESVR